MTAAFNATRSFFLAEIIGTSLFSFIGFGLHDQFGVLPDWLTWGVGLAFAVRLTSWLEAGHANPAVTGGLMLSGSVPLWRVPIYIVAQFLGFTIGTLLALGVSTEHFAMASASRYEVYGAMDSYHAAFCQAAGVGFLVLVVGLVSGNSEFSKTLQSGLIGLALLVPILSVGERSGGAFNPARALVPAVMARDGGHTFWVYTLEAYVIGPMIGMVVGALFILGIKGRG